jgi:hypothetical protein
MCCHPFQEDENKVKKEVNLTVNLYVRQVEKQFSSMKIDNFGRILCAYGRLQS